MVIDPQIAEVETPDGRLVYHLLNAVRPSGYVVWLQEVNQHLDLCWTDPTVSVAISGLAVRDNLTSVAMQSRGVGLSEPMGRRATVEEQAADVLAVMDAEGIERATLIGTASCGLAVALVAAQHPDRVHGLVLLGTGLTGPLVAEDDYGWTPAQARVCIDGYRKAVAAWGSGESLFMWDPALCTPLNVRLLAMLERCSASASLAAEYLEWLISYDGREIFPQVRVPTRVLYVPGHSFPLAAKRALADAIPGAELHVLPANQLGDSIGSAWAPVARHVAEVALGAGALFGTTQRVLASVLFTDIVGSTEHLARLGDAAWTTKLHDHHQLMSRAATQHGGRLVGTAGDGALCEFPGPANAIHAGQAICLAGRILGVEIRAGVHTGECERHGDDLAGLAVHIGARIAALAGPGEVLTSRTVRDLVAGAGLTFTPRGKRELKGVPDRWELYTVDNSATGASPKPPQSTPVDRFLVKAARRAPATLRAANRIGNAIQRRRMADA